jgi:tetratricopeptide (TPR) repeat protein
VPEITRSVPWERTLLDLTLGKADPNAALSQAADDAQRGQVFYYTAERMITVGHPERAADLLSRAVPLLPKGLDRILAASRLSALSSAPAASGQASAGTGVDHVIQVAQRVSALNDQANQLFQQGKAREALPLFEQISALRREAAGEQDPVYAGTLYDLGAVHLTLGDMDKAESYYRRALAIQEATRGVDDPSAVATRKELAGVLASRGDMDAAAVMYRDVLAAEKKLGAHHTAEWVEMALMLTRFYSAKNDHTAVERLLRDAGDVSRDVHGPHATATLDVLNRLVALLIDRRRFADAQPFCAELLDARRASADTAPSDLADTLDSMAQIAAGLGDSARAEALWQEALTLSSKTS